MFFVFLFVFCTLFNPIYGYSLSSLQFSVDGSSLPPQLTLGAGESLYLSWKPTEEALSECQLVKPDKSVVTLPNSAERDIEFFGPSMDQGYCGAKVNKVDVNKTGIWGLEARSKKEKVKYSTETYVTVLAPLIVVNKTITSSGESVRIDCGRDFTDVVQCELISPLGQKTLYNRPCSFLVIQQHLISSVGLWVCKFTVLNYLSDFWASVRLELKVIKNEIGYKDYPNEMVVYCNLAEPKRLTKYCRLTTPQGEDLNLGPGRGHGMYTYYGSKPSECGVSIPKPLKKHDLGLWKCDLAIDSESHFGGYVNIGNDFNMINKISVENENIFWSKDDGLLFLRCRVNYSIEYCWFRSPNGTIYTVENFKEKHTGIYWNFMFGECVFQIKHPKPENTTGKWTCHIGLMGDSLFELSSHINVIYSENLLLTQKNVISAKEGESVDLFCRTGISQAIKYCRFVRPDGQGLTLSETLNTTMYSYQGRGYKYGDCGIKIHHPTTEDFGQWMCIINLGGSEEQLKVELKKIEGGKWWITVVAVVLGLGVVGVGGLFAYKWFTRRTWVVTRDDTSPLTERDEEEEDTQAGGRLSIGDSPDLRQRRTHVGELHPGSAGWI